MKKTVKKHNAAEETVNFTKGTIFTNFGLLVYSNFWPED